MRNRVIDGRFELLERLGGGGMGLVWRARDVALERDVALKEVRPPDPSMHEHNPAGAAELRARVLREARALARLNHPHVATIHHIVDPGEHGYPWIVMELVTGGSLQDRLERGPMPPADAARLGREVLSALRAAHAVGILHRDIKPANVLLREDGRSVLTDFGIAAVRESTSLTATGAFIGSPEYMAPERINGVEGDPASDLWSLGMMLYVAVEGRHPLRRSSTLATLAAVLNQDVPPPERAGPLGPVLKALLIRDTAARPDIETLDLMLAAAADPGASEPPGRQPIGAPPAWQPNPSQASWRPTGPSHPSSPPPMASQPGGATPVPGQPNGSRPPVGRPHGTVPPAQQGPWEPTRPPARRRGGTGAAVAVSLSAVVVAGVLVWQLIPAPDVGRTPAAARVTPTSGPAASSSPPASTPAPVNLLTPAGIRDMIAKLKPVIGGSKVVEMVVYPTYASIDVPLKDDPELYDTYVYRDGGVARAGHGGKVEAPLVDLAGFDWDTVPRLLKRADNDLGVPRPTRRYLIVDPDYAFASTRQVLLVYVSDDYRSGYLVANPKGKVLKLYPDD
ncbi:Serine/threonine protein kinase [Nonomuraea maritima]|uniref:non-specific serine/threonine protein kinase n=1 Tax=Nonomuraea maritima TaxID=683260 RepID=A0A1G8V8C2_9ACTN|nr:serine/threonine-protein kinase [Nonomuraea maritima]SDJ62107.1 Serine/threonine protein kinase [Nonomuraea maritima]